MSPISAAKTRSASMSSLMSRLHELCTVPTRLRVGQFTPSRCLSPAISRTLTRHVLSKLLCRSGCRSDNRVSGADIPFEQRTKSAGEQLKGRLVAALFLLAAVVQNGRAKGSPLSHY